MRRREFITLLGGAAASSLAWPPAPRAQSMPLIGFLGSVSPVGWQRYMAGFHLGMKDEGFVESRNVAIEYRWAEGRYDQLPKLAAELVNLRVAVLVASGGAPPALAAKAATATIPVVFTAVADAVALGLVASFNRPGANLTGVSAATAVLVAKRLELLSEIAPKAATFGLLVNANSQSAAAEVDEARRAAATRGKSLEVFKAATEDDFEPVLADFVSRRGDALIVSADPFFNVRRERLVTVIARHAVPAIYGWREYPLGGGLVSYGADLAEQYRQAGVYTGRILKGTKPADLPIVQPVKFELVINLKTARTLGLTVPQTLLTAAEEVVE